MGRDDLKAGCYTGRFFAERNIRYIAINDGADSDKGDNNFTPFRNLFNDFHARDTSKKIRAVMRANKRRPAKQAERQGLFSGLLYCADCGSKLHFATGKNRTPEQDCYRCARYKSNTGDCTMHFIRKETLKRFVLRRIFDVTAMFFEDIMRFQKAVYGQRFEEAERAAKKTQAGNCPGRKADRGT